MRGADGTTDSLRRLRIRHFTVAEIDRALEEAGFVATERYGDFDRRPFDAAHSRQVVVAVPSGS
jgi:hypothetical protein